MLLPNNENIALKNKTMLQYALIVLLAAVDSANITQSQFMFMAHIVDVGNPMCICPKSWQPVCASNGITYRHKLCIECTRYIVVHEGPCKEIEEINGSGESEQEEEQLPVIPNEKNNKYFII